MKRILVVGLLILCVSLAVWLRDSDTPPSLSATRTLLSSRAGNAAVPGPATQPTQSRVENTDASPSAIPDLAQVCEEMRGAQNEGRAYSPWFLKHYPNEYTAIERYYSETKYDLKYEGEGTFKVEAPESDSVDDANLMRQAERGDLAAAGLLGARMSAANASSTARDAAHLARLQEAEKWLLIAIRGGEHSLWYYYAMARGQQTSWLLANEIRALKEFETTLPKAEYDLRRKSLRDARERDEGIEMRAINEFSKPHQSLSDQRALAMMLKLGPAREISESDPLLPPRIDALKNVFADAHLYTLNELQQEEMREAERALKTVEAIAARIAVACGPIEGQAQAG